MAVAVSKDWLQGAKIRPGAFPVKGARTKKKRGVPEFPHEKNALPGKKRKKQKSGAVAGMLAKRFSGRG